ncbi:MAG: transaldolase [Nitrospirae bacterium]|nr:transaldolase [Nitrospirota bacterium]
MRPENLKTRIFLDGGDPDETKKIIGLLGFLDGQTTNPTLISKNPAARQRIEGGEKFSREEILEFYGQVVKEISALIPQGSISVEVYADTSTTSEEMIKQSREMFSWIPNAHIKFPITHEGLKAAGKSIKEGLRVNMTLCFTQEQASAVYAATEGAKRGDVFVSPFVGRLDDRGENGMVLISNIIKMYQKGDGHVEVLTASVRNIDHLLYALKLESDIVTAPFKILKEWGEKGLLIPGNEYTYNTKGLKVIPFKDFDLTKKWQDYNIYHELTDRGIESFSSDWNALIQ